MKVNLFFALMYNIIFICNAQNLSLSTGYIYDKPTTFQLALDEHGNIDIEKLPKNVTIVDMNMDNRFDAFVFHENKLEMHYGLINGFSNNVSATWKFDQPINEIKSCIDHYYLRGRLDIEFENGKTDIIIQWQNKMVLKSKYNANPEIYQVKTELPQTINVDDNFKVIWEAPNLGYELSDINMLISDVDQDGKKELIFQSSPVLFGGLNILYVYENTNDNNFQMVYSYEDTTFGYGLKEITDLDADGNLEIATLPRGGPIGWTLDPYLILFECNGDNSFNRQMIQAFVNIQEITPFCMRWVDSNLNGKPELVIGFERDIGTPSSYVHFYENINPGTFDRLHWWLQVYGSYLHGIAVGDLDNDGWGDIYVGRAGASTQLLRWEYNGYQSFEQKWFDTEICNPIFPEIFDFDEDGLLELSILSDYWNYYPGKSAILYVEAVGDDSLQIIALDTTSYYHGSACMRGRNWNTINNEYYITAPAEIFPDTGQYFDGYGILLKRNPNFIYPFEPIFYSPIVDSTAIHHALAADLDSDNKVELITGKRFYPARVRIWEDQTTSIIIDQTKIINNFDLTAYPNPFNNAVTVSFTLPIATKIDIEIINILSQKIIHPVKQKVFSSGNHHLLIDHLPSSGLYLLTMKGKDFSQTIKLLLIK